MIESPQSLFYYRTLEQDPRWRGPYLAAALLFGLETNAKGYASSAPIKVVSWATGLGQKICASIFHALVVQGYIQRSPGGGYLLDGRRPLIDLQNGSVRIAGWKDRDVQRIATLNREWLHYATSTGESLHAPKTPARNEAEQ